LKVVLQGVGSFCLCKDPGGCAMSGCVRGAIAIALLGVTAALGSQIVTAAEKVAEGAAGGAADRPAPMYRIYPLRNGACKIAGNHAFHGGNREETCDSFDAFPNARLVVNRREYEESKGRLARDVKQALAARPGALQLVEDEEIVPGVRVLPLGCHSPGSQGVLVETYLGPAVIAGDVVYKYENIERERPTRSPDPRACREAMAKIRGLADIVLPGHDPLVLGRWPGGIIGGRR